MNFKYSKTIKQISKEKKTTTKNITKTTCLNPLFLNFFFNSFFFYFELKTLNHNRFMSAQVPK